MKESWGERLKTFPEVGEACSARCGVRQAVVVANPRDDVDALRFAAKLPVETRDLVRGVVRLTATRPEIGHLEVARREVRELGCKPYCRGRSKTAIGRAEGKRFHLFGRRGGKLLAAVSDVYVPQGRHAVDVLATLDVGERRALAAHDDELRDGSRGSREIALRVKPVRTVQLGQEARLRRGESRKGFMDGHAYAAVKPPSTAREAPVMCMDSSLDRNSIAPATSMGSAIRR